MKIPAMSVRLSYAARNFVKNNHKQAGMCNVAFFTQSKEVFLVGHVEVMEMATAHFFPAELSHR